MKKHLLIIFFLIPGLILAQIPEKRILVSGNFMLSKTFGSSSVTYNNASFNNYFPNIKSSMGFKTDITWLINENIGLGAVYCSSFMSDWEYKSYKDFTLSHATVQFFGPTAFYQSRLCRNSRLTVFCRAGAGMSFVKVNLDEPAVYIYDQSGRYLDKIRSTANAYPGIYLSSGFMYSISSLLSVSVAADYNLSRTESAIYPDKRISMLSFDAGIIFKFKKDHRNYF